MLTLAARSELADSGGVEPRRPPAILPRPTEDGDSRYLVLPAETCPEAPVYFLEAQMQRDDQLYRHP